MTWIRVVGEDEGRPPEADRVHFVHRIALGLGVEFGEDEVREYDDGERLIGD